MARDKEWEKQCYGIELDMFMESVHDSGTDYLMAAASILSDCQEMMARDGNSDACKEDVRQAMNRAKRLIFAMRGRMGREQVYALSEPNVADAEDQ